MYISGELRLSLRGRTKKMTAIIRFYRYDKNRIYLEMSKTF